MGLGQVLCQKTRKRSETRGLGPRLQEPIQGGQGAHLWKDDDSRRARRINTKASAHRGRERKNSERCALRGKPVNKRRTERREISTLQL